MSILDRVLLFLLSLASLCLGVVLALVGVNVVGPGTIRYLSLAPFDLVDMIVGVIIVLLALRFLFYRMGRPSSTDFVAMAGEHGQIRLSHDTIRQLANRKGMDVKGAQGFDSRIRHGQNGIVILVRMQVLPDIDISATSREVQSVVKDYVEKTSGVTVEQVLVHVTEVSNTPKHGKAWSGA